LAIADSPRGEPRPEARRSSPTRGSGDGTRRERCACKTLASWRRHASDIEFDRYRSGPFPAAAWLGRRGTSAIATLSRPSTCAEPRPQPGALVPRGAPAGEGGESDAAGRCGGPAVWARCPAKYGRRRSSTPSRCLAARCSVARHNDPHARTAHRVPDLQHDRHVSSGLNSGRHLDVNPQQTCDQSRRAPPHIAP
jgi:hypothetical protein